jgi:hypothetical protein
MTDLDVKWIWNIFGLGLKIRVPGVQFPPWPQKKGAVRAATPVPINNCTTQDTE